MRTFVASLYKDIRLSMGRSAKAAVLLPVLLLVVLYFFLGSMSSTTLLRPFPITIIDQDDTYMSHSLIKQLEELDLFSEIFVETLDGRDAAEESAAVPDGNSPEEMARQQTGSENDTVAVITIPQGFFYALYQARECPVQVTLSETRPVEAALVASMFSSVMEIITSDQAADYAVYQLVYGDLAESRRTEMYDAASLDIFKDALGRQRVFDGNLEETDWEGILKRRIAVAICSMMTIYLAGAAARSFVQEFRMGLPQRIRSGGGSLFAVVLSKYLVTAVFFIPTLAALYMLVPFSQWIYISVICLTAMLALLIFFVLLGVLCKSENVTVRISNLALLLVLCLGGIFWPVSKWMRALIILIPLAAGIVEVIRSRRTDRVTGQTLSSVLVKGMAAARLLRLSGWQLGQMAGGIAGAVFMTISVCISGYAVDRVLGHAGQVPHLAIVDEDKTEASAELTGRLERQQGISVRICTAREADRMLQDEAAEGMLVIPGGFSQHLFKGDELALHYEGSQKAVSIQGIREIIAGQAIAMSSRIRAEKMAQEMLQRTLTDQERQELLSGIERQMELLPKVYQLKQAKGGQIDTFLMPSLREMMILVILVTTLSYASMQGRRDARMVRRRMMCYPHGSLLQYGSMMLPLVLAGIVWTAIFATLQDGLHPSEFPIVLGYILCVAALSLCLAAWTGVEGRIDGLGPFLAVLLCLVGGCFADLSLLGPGWEMVSLASPAGQFLHAARGSKLCMVLLYLEAVVFSVVAFPKKK